MKNISLKNILFVYILFALLWVLFGPKVPTENVVAVKIVSDAKNYTLPKTPVISLDNATDAAITVDTCRDIQIATNALQKSNLPSQFCRVVDVPAKSITPLFGQSKEDISFLQEQLYAVNADVVMKFAYTNPTTSEITESQVEIGPAGLLRVFFRKVFYDPVYNLFAALILIFPGYSLGWAIVTITVIIRLILLVPQQHMLVSQRKMQAIQPKIKAIQEEHKGDQATIGMKMMALYKKEGVNPLGSCLPILIQIPILIVLYQVILNIGNPANLAHLYHFSWLEHFRNVTISMDFFGMKLGTSGGIVGVTLGLLTGGLQFGQMWLSQKKNKPSADLSALNEKLPEGMPDMQQMQKMMIYIFPVMAAIFAFQFPAGVGLYWLIGTMFMIVQQYFANKQAEEKKMVIRDKAGNIIG